MPRVKVSVVIDAPPAVVWGYVEDVAGHTDWMLDAVAIRFLTSRTSGVGTSFECDTKLGPFKLTDVMAVTEWAPGRAMGVTHSGLVTGTGRFTLKKLRGGRTLFTWKEKLDLPWFLGGPVGALVAKPVLAQVWKRSLANLKAVAEASR